MIRIMEIEEGSNQFSQGEVEGYHINKFLGS